MANNLTGKWGGLVLLLVLAFVLEAQIGASNLAELVTFGLFALSLIGAALLSVPDSRSRTTFIGIGVFWYLCSIATIFGVPLRPVVAVLTLVILAGSLFGTFRYLMTSEAKDTDALLAAVYGYLLLAMSWAILYFQIHKNGARCMSTNGWNGPRRSSVSTPSTAPISG